MPDRSAIRRQGGFGKWSTKFCLHHQSSQLRQGFDTHAMHYGRPVVFDCPLANAKIDGNILAWMSGQDHVHDFTLP